MLKFNAKTFLINRLVETTSFIFVNFETRTDYGVALFFEYKISC